MCAGDAYESRSKSFYDLVVRTLNLHKQAAAALATEMASEDDGGPITDRGTPKRGIFSRALAQNGVLIRHAGVESPHKIGHIERHGGLWKRVLKWMVADHALVGEREVRVAMPGSIAAKLPRGPRDQGDEQEFADLGLLDGQLDPPTEFGRRALLCTAAKWVLGREDCGTILPRSILRKAAAFVNDDRAGGCVCYRRRNTGWWAASRIMALMAHKPCVWCTGEFPGARPSTACAPRPGRKRWWCNTWFLCTVPGATGSGAETRRHEAFGIGRRRRRGLRIACATWAELSRPRGRTVDRGGRSSFDRLRCGAGA